MPTQVTHFIECCGTRVQLTLAEAQVVARGEISRKMQARLEELGIKLPPRGTVDYRKEIRFNPPAIIDGQTIEVIRTEAHMRRLPDWERKSA